MQVETENWFLVVSGAENKIVMPDDKRTSRPNLFFEWIAPLDYLVCPYTAWRAFTFQVLLLSP